MVSKKKVSSSSFESIGLAPIKAQEIETKKTVYASSRIGIATSASLITAANPESITLYTVPSSKVFYLTSAYCSGVGAQSGATVAARLRLMNVNDTTDIGYPILLAATMSNVNAGQGNITVDLTEPIRFPSGTVFYALANLCYGSIGIVGYLEDN